MAKKKEDLGQRFYKLIETLFRELDQESIKAEVEALQKKKPKFSREEIAQELISRTAKKTALVGATAGVAGGSFGLLAAAPDIFNLVRSQSRLVLSIAFLYGQKPGLEERFREVLAVLAMSTGASATRQGVRYLIAKGLTGTTAEGIMKKVAGRFMARRLPTLAPLVGSVAGAGLNYMAVQATGKIAIEYYSSELAAKGQDQKQIGEGDNVEGAATSGSSSRKSVRTGAKKTSARSARGAATRSGKARTAGSAKKTSSRKTASKKAPSKRTSSKKTAPATKRRRPKTSTGSGSGEAV